VYGNVDELPITENTLPRPYSPYGTTKLAAEHLCMLYQANYGIPVVSLRYFTVYGPRQRPDMAFHIFSKAILRGEPITVLGDGNQTRDFTFVDDIVDANILSYRTDIQDEIFNLGGGCRISVNGVLELLEEITGIQPKVVRKERFLGDVKHTWADTSRAKTKLGFDPKVPLQEGLRKEFEWAKTIYG
jgi:UDP-glucose 4-epimerase